MNQKGFVSLWLIGALVVILGLSGYFAWHANVKKETFMAQLRAGCTVLGDKTVVGDCAKLIAECRIKYPGDKMCHPFN